MDKNDIIFACYKCGHRYYINKEYINFEIIKELLDFNCPTCGEEPYENWILYGLGNFDNRSVVDE